MKKLSSWKDVKKNLKDRPEEMRHKVKLSLKFSKYTNEEIEKIKESGSDKEREELAEGLYDNKDYDTLKTMIKDSDGDVRYWVAWSLYYNKDYDTLKTMINDSYEYVRYCVGCGLVDSEDWNTLEKFLEKEKNVWVKEEIEQKIADKILEKHFRSQKEEV